MRKLEIFLADLFYINRLTKYRLCVPLNIGYVGAYTRKLFDNEVNIHLFKDVNVLLERAKSIKPDVVGFSFYYWNTNLNYFVVRQIRALYKDDVKIVFGGPSIDSINEEHRKLLVRFPEVDLFVEGEGEIGFSRFIERVLSTPEKVFEDPIDSSFFHEDGEIVKGLETGFTLPLKEVPSPYLNGYLDQFLARSYMPLLQATRMCPYTCNFCVSGKDKGIVRAFPMDTVKEEIDYIARWNKDNPHIIFNLAELNFGINKQDPEIAEYLRRTSEKVGYPQSVYFYSDKRFTKRARDVIDALGNINRYGLVFSLQSDNPETVNVIKRKNLSDQDVEAGISWARERNIPVSTELIFGLPFETYDSMVKTLEKSIDQGFDSVMLHNLFLMEGIELNREEFRNKYIMKTMYRLLGSNYTKIDGEFIAEYEEVLVENKFFDFNDFLSIRALNLLFFSVFQGDFYKIFFRFVKGIGIPLVSYFGSFMKPDPDHEWPESYLRFVRDFKEAATKELYSSLDEMYSDAKEIYEGNNDVGEPVRLNSSYYSRLMYFERDWIKYVLIQHLVLKADKIDKDTLEVANNILDICENLIIDLKQPHNNSVLETEFDFDGWKQSKYREPLHSFRNGKRTINFSMRDSQKEKIRSFCEQNSNLDDRDFGFVAVETVLPRSDLFYEIIYE
jgi:radical SAM superfamily enzyme YgiQ (UPF0313 family)